MENEIDLLELLKKLWRGRKVILLAGVAACVIGIVVALVSPVKFTASCVMVPQTGNQQGGQLGGLAAMAGINMGSESGEVLSPSVYPQIMSSVPFQKELMQTRVNLRKKSDQPISLLDFFADSTKMKKPAPMVVAPEGIGVLSPRESAAIGALRKNVTLTIDKKEGIVTLHAVMPEALAAAEVAAAAQNLLQRYITEFKIQKVQATLDFVEGRTEEARKEYEAAQSALAAARDHNRNIVTATGQITLQRLDNEYNLAYSVYSGLLQQREQARIKVKETTPVFTVIEPVTVPTLKSAPKRTMMVVVAGFLGGIIGCLLVLLGVGKVRNKE